MEQETKTVSIKKRTCKHCGEEFEYTKEYLDGSIFLSNPVIYTFCTKCGTANITRIIKDV